MPFNITLDGPAGAGKGTLGERLAASCGLHYLDSGLMYRRVAVAVLAKNIDPQDVPACVEAVRSLTEADLTTNSSLLRSEQVGMMAAKVSPHQEVRTEINLLIRRLLLRQPGTILDGRAGASEFPDVNLKIYLDASAAVRAKRRFDQLKARGEAPNLETILGDVIKRDKQDTERSIASMVPAKDAIVINTDDTTADEVFEYVMQHTTLSSMRRR